MVKATQFAVKALPFENMRKVAPKLVKKTQAMPTIARFQKRFELPTILEQNIKDQYAISCRGRLYSARFVKFLMIHKCCILGVH
eukprot:1314024-Amphidinium_carterae.1